MIDAHGHLIHIDFGFVFGLAPGKAFSMEKAPFKLTLEFVEALGGIESDLFKQYRSAVAAALLEARRHADALCNMMEIMAHQSNYPAFKYNSNAIADFRARMHLNVADEQIPALTNRLIDQ